MCFRHGMCPTSSLRPVVGLRQGCSLSPMLFLWVLSDVLAVAALMGSAGMLIRHCPVSSALGCSGRRYLAWREAAGGTQHHASRRRSGCRTGLELGFSQEAPSFGSSACQSTRDSRGPASSASGRPASSKQCDRFRSRWRVGARAASNHARGPERCDDAICASLWSWSRHSARLAERCPADVAADVAAHARRHHEPLRASDSRTKCWAELIQQVVNSRGECCGKSWRRTAKYGSHSRQLS